MKKDNSLLPRLVVQIPAYNEEKTIAKVIKEIPRKIHGIKDVRVLVIDDGSTDKTSEEARKAGADYLIVNKPNRGLGPSFKKGIDKSLELGADVIVNIDGDGQFNSKDVEKIIQPILKGDADMVTCSRFIEPEFTDNMPLIKKWGNRRFTNLVNRITGRRFTDTQCGFRAYSREASLRLNLNGKFTYTQEVFLDLVSKGMRIKEIPLHVRYSPVRNSAISGNLARYGFRTLAIITRATRDTQPLVFFGVPGIIMFLLGFLGGVISFVYWLLEHVTTPVRMLFNVSVFFMIFGISLLVLALLADMLKSVKKTQDETLYRLKKWELQQRT